MGIVLIATSSADESHLAVVVLWLGSTYEQFRLAGALVSLFCRNCEPTKDAGDLSGNVPGHPVFTSWQNVQLAIRNNGMQPLSMAQREMPVAAAPQNQRRTADVRVRHWQFREPPLVAGAHFRDKCPNFTAAKGSPEILP